MINLVEPETGSVVSGNILRRQVRLCRVGDCYKFAGSSWSFIDDAKYRKSSETTQKFVNSLVT